MTKTELLKAITTLEEQRRWSLPASDDDTYGTDGSPEALAGLFEQAFHRADSVAARALGVMRVLADDMPDDERLPECVAGLHDLCRGESLMLHRDRCACWCHQPPVEDA